MKEVIDWLRHVEQLASDVYQTASDYFSKDKEFSAFLSGLAEDESLHFHLIGHAAQYLQETKQHLVSAVSIDSSIKDHVETPLKRLYNLTASRTITKQDVVECIVKVESSEWNDIFLYVIKTFQEYGRIFEYVAATIQTHEKKIENFLEQLPGNLEISENIRKLSRIWKERILIVEDDRPIRELLAKFLSTLGDIETANNGQEALDKTKDHFFNVVISDIDMPVMSGLEFYQKAVEMNPDIADRFLFCSGKITPSIEAFCREHNLMYFEKPFKLQQLHQAVGDKITERL
jgi:CheY-like chemotaxis protein